MNESPNYHDILGVRVASSLLPEVLEKIEEKVGQKASDRPFWITTVNPEIVMKAVDDARYKEILNKSDLRIADGVGLKLGGVRDITPGRRIVEEVCKNHDYRLFFLGGRDGVSKLIAEKYGGSYDNGEENINDPKDNNRILKKINDYKSDVLFVAYGAPWQEKWIYENLDKLKVKVVMGVGGSFDYLVGRAKLPPVWMSKMGLEWLWRLVQEPWRWRRQLNLVRFAWKLLQTSGRL